MMEQLRKWLDAALERLPHKNYTPEQKQAMIKKATLLGGVLAVLALLLLTLVLFPVLRVEVEQNDSHYTDEEIADTMRKCFKGTGYTLDPHGACGYQALKDGLKDNEIGIFCETAHPAKFKETVEGIISSEVAIPERLAEFMKGTKQSVELSKEFADFKSYLLKQ